MTYLNKNLKVSSQLKRQDEIYGLLSVVDECHYDLMKLEQGGVKNLEVDTEILSLRKFLEAQVRDYPELVQSWPIRPIMQRYASC